MKHVYNEAELRGILSKADRKLTHSHDGISIEGDGFGFDTSWMEYELVSLRAILDALPEPATDDWQECGPEALRKGDRYLLQGKTWHFEGVLHGDPTEDDIVLAYHPHRGQLIHAGPETVTFFDRENTTLYRIPAPFQHPDPDVDRVLVMHGWLRGYTEHCEPTESITMIYDGANYVGYDPGSAQRISLAPANITDWTPAKVVEDDR